MKKFAPYLILFVLALVALDGLFDMGGMTVNVGGDEFDGPLGALLGLLLAGGGTIFAALVMVVVCAVLAVVFAGVGIVVIAALCFAALSVAAAVSPLLLVLLAPVALIWLMVNRSRRNRALREQPV